MNARKSLVKVFAPVLLLTASLALPMDTMAAPAHDRQAAHEKAEKKDKKDKQNKGARKQAQARQRQQKAQQAQQKAARQQAIRQKIARQDRQRQLQAQRQLELQQRQGRLQRQNQLRLQQQRQLELQRQAELRRQAEIRQRNAYRNNRYDNRYATPYRSGGRRGGGGADPNIFHVDGYLNNEGSECLSLRDHNGRLWALAGNTRGLQPGEHVRLYGRIVDGGVCGWQGTAFDIHEVRTVWADDRHRTTYYDHLHDGPFN